MTGFIARQPNGLLCRFSFIVGCPTHYNMTDEKYVDNETGNLLDRDEGEEILEKHLRPFSDVLKHFAPDNMSQEEFDLLLELVGYKEGEGVVK